MHPSLETSELQAFAETVNAESLSGAAKRLRVPRATISRRLARLEAQLGVRLLRRTTRSLVLTDAGESFYRHVRMALDAVSAAEQSVRRKDKTPRGDLRVSVPPAITPNFLAMLTSFAKTYPHVRLHVHFTSAFADLIRDGYDVALRASTSLEPGLVARVLSRTPLVLVASPDYLAARGTPRTKRDLRHHACLLGFARGQVPHTSWPSPSGAVHVEGAFFSNEPRLLLDAALENLGIALLPHVFVLHHLSRGSLVQVLDGVVFGESQLSLVYADREFVPAHVRAFVDDVSSWFREHESEFTGKDGAETCVEVKKHKRAK